MKPLIVNPAHARVPRRWLMRWLAELSRLIKKEKLGTTYRKEIVVVFVTPSEMRKMNRDYRKKNYVTDILSFEAVEDTSLGELVLCLPVIERQAKETGLGPRGELGYMLVHGVLHLLGFDHETSAEDEKEMFSLQDRLFARLRERVGLR